MPYHMGHIIKFPERRSDIAKLRAEIAEMDRIVSVRSIVRPSTFQRRVRVAPVR